MGDKTKYEQEMGAPSCDPGDPTDRRPRQHGLREAADGHANVVQHATTSHRANPIWIRRHP